MSEFFLSTTFRPDGSKVSEVINECLDAGICNLELGSNHCHEEDLLEKIPLNKGTFIVHNYFPAPKEPFVLNLSSHDESLRKKSEEQAFRALEFCDASGAQLYTFHAGFMTDPGGPGRTEKNYDFKWGNEKTSDPNAYRETFELMLRGVAKVSKRASQLGVPIAIETEGTYRHPGHLLMQRPEEFVAFFEEFGPDEVGINLNIGHLPLAAKSFEFRIDDFVELVASRVLAMEMSHNDCIDDQHLPLLEEAWYWAVILDERFDKIKKILEFRETSLDKVIANLELCRRKQASKN